MKRFFLFTLIVLTLLGCSEEKDSINTVLPEDLSPKIQGDWEYLVTLPRQNLNAP